MSFPTSFHMLRKCCSDTADGWGRAVMGACFPHWNCSHSFFNIVCNSTEAM